AGWRWRRAPRRWPSWPRSAQTRFGIASRGGSLTWCHVDTIFGSMGRSESRPFAMTVAVDIVLLAVKERRLSLLLIRRGIEPFRGRWALPGGAVLEHEDLDQAAARELAEEAGVRAVYLEQFRAYGAPGRDPRGRVVSVAYVALVRADQQVLAAATDADAAAWFPIDRLPELAFDHRTIVAAAQEHVRRALDREPVGFQLLPRAFTLAA